MSGDIDGLFQSIDIVKKYMQKKKYASKKIDDSIQSYSERLSLSEKELAKTNEHYTNLKSRLSSAVVLKENITNKTTELQERDTHIDSEISTHESHIDSLKDRISIVEKNYATGEQERIANELMKINNKKAEIENSFTILMNEYRDKESQLTTLQTQDNREKSQSNRLTDEENSLNQQHQELTNKIQQLEKQKESKNESLVKLREKEQELIATSGSSIGQLKEYDEKLKGLTEKEKELTKQISTLETTI